MCRALARASGPRAQAMEMSGRPAAGPARAEKSPAPADRAVQPWVARCQRPQLICGRVGAQSCVPQPRQRRCVRRVRRASCRQIQQRCSVRDGHGSFRVRHAAWSGRAEVITWANTQLIECRRYSWLLGWTPKRLIIYDQDVSDYA
jgi:hypothetical protein